MNFKIGKYIMPRLEHDNDVDVAISHKIHNERVLQGMSRKQLSAELGITIQQLGKYESGQNNVSASRLLIIANALNKSILWFYDNPAQTKKSTAHTRLCLEATRNFRKIKNRKHQEAINSMIKSLIEG